MKATDYMSERETSDFNPGMKANTLFSRSSILSNSLIICIKYGIIVS